MTTRKRRKSSRYPGTKTHGRGRKNRTRGLGNRGGRGLSGTGKRGDQKKTLVIKLYGGDYFGKVRRGAGLREKKRLPSMSLSSLKAQLGSLVKEGKAREQKGLWEIDVKEYKIIGGEGFDLKAHIHARAASAGALKTVASSGGTVTLSPEKKGAD